jgi:hypothetical protein
LAELIDDQYAVMCVHHDYHLDNSQVLQTFYPKLARIGL